MVEELYWTMREREEREEEDPDEAPGRIYSAGSATYDPAYLTAPEPDPSAFGDPFEGEETTMPETEMASLRELAAAARSERDAMDAERENAERARQRKEATTALVDRVRDVLVIQISADDITWRYGRPRYITEGLEFGLNSGHSLELYKVCEECGRTAGCAVYSLRGLDNWLRSDVLPYHCCGEIEGDRNYRGPAAPPRIVTESEAALLDALRAYVRSMQPDPE